MLKIFIKRGMVLMAIIFFVSLSLLPDVMSNDIVMTNLNNPPIIKYPSPDDGSLNIELDTSQLSVTIEDPEGDKMDWSIETKPDIGSNNGYGAENGTISCDISGLHVNTTYYWYVNVTDPFGSNEWISEKFCFTTVDKFIPTVAEIIIEVQERAGKNAITVGIIPSYDYIYDWFEINNKVRIKWNVNNDNNIKWDKGNFTFHARIGEQDEHDLLPSFSFFTKSGRIVTPDGEWIDIKIPIRDESDSGEELIDVSLLELDDMLQ